MTSLSVLARRGQLQKHMADERRIVRAAPRKALDTASRRLQLAVRNEVNRGIGSRRKIGNAIRRKGYDNPDGAASIVYSRFGRGRGAGFVDYLTIFTKGATLRPQSSKFLYIPLERGRKARRDRRLSVRANKNLTFIPARDGRSFYIARVTKTRTTLIAKLVRRVKIRKRLDFDRLVGSQDRRIAEALVETLDEDADAQP